MYKSVDAALSCAYRFGALRIEPQNNTAQVISWVGSKGVRGGGGDLSQAEWHANAAMIQQRVEETLGHMELMAVECQYGKVDLYHIVDLTIYVTKQDPKVDTLMCDAILANMFTERPKLTEIMDQYDIGRKALRRQRQRVSNIVAGLINDAVIKLEPVFVNRGIINKDDKLTA